MYAEQKLQLAYSQSLIQVVIEENVPEINGEGSRIPVLSHRPSEEISIVVTLQDTCFIAQVKRRNNNRIKRVNDQLN